MSCLVKEQSVKEWSKNGLSVSRMVIHHLKMKKEEDAAQISMTKPSWTRPHVEARVIESIEEKGWDLLPHPPYSPTKAPTDYHINRSLKNWMSNKVYDDLDDLVDDVKAWIASKNRGFFERGIDMLPEKWEAVIEVDGEYAPE
uniref:Transposase n=1 Tax=Acrobeloides nanus TaxID=290746 RepID=A0A914DHZ1_9BILA